MSDFIIMQDTVQTLWCFSLRIDDLTVCDCTPGGGAHLIYKQIQRRRLLFIGHEFIRSIEDLIHCLETLTRNMSSSDPKKMSSASSYTCNATEVQIDAFSTSLTFASKPTVD